MRKEEKEKLVRKVREAQEYPFPQEHPFLVELGKRAVNPSRAPHLAKDLGLKVEEEKLIKWVAVFKREVLKENPKADFSRVLKKICKGSKMDESKERVKRLKARLKLNIYGKQEEKIKEFVASVIKEFESDLDSDFAREHGIVRNFITTSLNEAEFAKALDRIEKAGLTVVGWDRYPLKVCVELNVKKPKAEIKTTSKKRIDIDMSGGEAEIHRHWDLPVFPPF